MAVFARVVAAACGLWMLWYASVGLEGIRDPSHPPLIGAHGEPAWVPIYTSRAQATGLFVSCFVGGAWLLYLAIRAEKRKETEPPNTAP